MRTVQLKSLDGCTWAIVDEPDEAGVYSAYRFPPVEPEFRPGSTLPSMAFESVTELVHGRHADEDRHQREAARKMLDEMCADSDLSPEANSFVRTR